MKSSYSHLKRLAVVAFAVFYAAMVIGISTNRTAAWVDAFAHRQASGTSDSIDKSKVFVPQVRHPRLLQSHFVVEAPQTIAGTILAIDRHLETTPDFRHYGHSPLRIPSRAPPTHS